MLRFATSLIGVLVVDAFMGVLIIGMGWAVGGNATAAVTASADLAGVIMALYSLCMWRLSQVPNPTERRSQPPSSISRFSCKADIAVTPELLGKKTKCPKCGTKNQLPT